MSQKKWIQEARREMEGNVEIVLRDFEIKTGLGIVSIRTWAKHFRDLDGQGSHTEPKVAIQVEAPLP